MQATPKYPGSAGAATNAAPTGPFNDLDRVLSRAHTLIARVEALSEHLVGPYPVSGENASNEHRLSGVFGAVESEAARLSARIEDAELALVRIEREVNIHG